MKERLCSQTLLTADFKQKNIAPSLAILNIAFILILSSILLFPQIALSVNYGELENIRNPMNPPGSDADYILDIDNLSSDVITSGTVSGATVTQSGVNLDDHFLYKDQNDSTDYNIKVSRLQVDYSNMYFDSTDSNTLKLYVAGTLAHTWAISGAASRMLLETADAVLMETGDTLLLES